jgi:hypothetical protein
MWNNSCENAAVGKAEDCLLEQRQLLVKHLSLTRGPHASLTQNISFHLPSMFLSHIAPPPILLSNQGCGGQEGVEQPRRPGRGTGARRPGVGWSLCGSLACKELNSICNIRNSDHPGNLVKIVCLDLASAICSNYCSFRQLFANLWFK